MTRPMSEEEERDALMDSQFLAGVTAGWNAAQADDPNAAKAALFESRAGYLKPITERRSASSAERGLREALEAIRRTPSMPFPDPGAHSWRAYAMAVYAAWSRIQSIAASALDKATKA